MPDFDTAHPGGPTAARPRLMLLFALAAAASLAREAHAGGAEPTLEEALETMRPYSGKHVKGVDTSTLTGKVMSGYQGWFAAEGDGSGRGWVHYGRGPRFEPGRCTIDLWPDVSELDEDEKYPTKFRHADGSVAHVFSPWNRKTVVRHFKWMKEHGIDGAFVQRFANSVRRTRTATLRHRNVVLANCREGANLHGRVYAVMYDLSGLPAGGTSVVIEDWKMLVEKARITKDRAYAHHRGKPVVAVWGIGFRGDRKYTLEECARLVDFLKHDRRYGRCTVMLGVPSWWRERRRDCLDDPAVHEIIRKADIVSPWAVGRFGNPRGVERHAREVIKPDVNWCAREGLDYMPVVFPGFSWHNMKPDKPLGQIPRLKGRFIWSQCAEWKKAGATMIYQAMFDEVDEGTAIFKCTNDPPIGKNEFLTYEGLPTDHYMWLAGQAGRMLRGEIEVTPEPPVRAAARRR